MTTITVGDGALGPAQTHCSEPARTSSPFCAQHSSPGPPSPSQREPQGAPNIPVRSTARPSAQFLTRDVRVVGGTITQGRPPPERRRPASPWRTGPSSQAVRLTLPRSSLSTPLPSGRRSPQSPRADPASQDVSTTPRPLQPVLSPLRTARPLQLPPQAPLGLPPGLQCPHPPRLPLFPTTGPRPLSLTLPYHFPRLLPDRDQRRGARGHSLWEKGE